MAGKYERLRVIGRGSFGLAWLTKSKSSQRMYVVKEVRLAGMTDKDRSQAVNEVTILAGLGHVNVVRYREAFVEDGMLQIAMEYADGGDLNDIIRLNRKNETHFPESTILDWFVQICYALRYIHSKKILHRDLKPQNIFMTKQGMVKIGDFGIARMLRDTADHANTAIGTPYYLSPEICRRKPYNQKSDMWAAGCVLYEITSLTHPFEATSFSSLVMKIMRGKFKAIPGHYGPLLEDVIAVLLRVNATRRPTAEQLLNIPGFKQHVLAYQDRCKNQSVHCDVNREGPKENGSKPKPLLRRHSVASSSGLDKQSSDKGSILRKVLSRSKIVPSEMQRKAKIGFSKDDDTDKPVVASANTKDVPLELTQDKVSLGAYCESRAAASKIVRSGSPVPVRKHYVASLDDTPPHSRLRRANSLRISYQLTSPKPPRKANESKDPVRGLDNGGISHVGPNNGESHPIDKTGSTKLTRWSSIPTLSRNTNRSNVPPQESMIATPKVNSGSPVGSRRTVVCGQPAVRSTSESKDKSALPSASWLLSGRTSLRQDSPRRTKSTSTNTNFDGEKTERGKSPGRSIKRKIARLLTHSKPRSFSVGSERGLESIKRGTGREERAQNGTQKKLNKSPSDSAVFKVNRQNIRSESKHDLKKATYVLERPASNGVADTRASANDTGFVSDAKTYKVLPLSTGRSLRKGEGGVDSDLGSNAAIVDVHDYWIDSDYSRNTVIESGKQLTEGEDTSLYSEDDEANGLMADINECLFQSRIRAGDSARDVRGRIEALRIFLEEKLGSEDTSTCLKLVKAVSGTQLYIQPDAEGDLMTQIQDVLGERQMAYFPVVLHVHNMEQSCDWL